MIYYPSNTVYDCHGIPAGCADFTIKRHDTRPIFKVDITDCDEPIDLTDLIIEASLWCNAKLKTSITTISTTISFADNIGFEQINTDTIIQIGAGRAFERMLIQSIDEESKTVTVIRGQLDTQIYNWKKGAIIKLLRFLNNSAVGEIVYDNVEQMDGSIIEHQLIRSTLTYEWKPGDTCMTGKYFLELKILKMLLEDNTPISSGISNTNYHCALGAYVDWVRRFPSDREGFLIEIFDSPTAE